MTYQITSDNIQVSESMEFLVKEKFSKIESRFEYLPEDAKHIRVVINAMPDDRFVLKVNVHVLDKDYFSDEEDYSVEGAILKVVEELLRIIEKDHAKRGSLDEKKWKEARDAKREISLEE